MAQAALSLDFPLAIIRLFILQIFTEHQVPGAIPGMGIFCHENGRKSLPSWSLFSCELINSSFEIILLRDNETEDRMVRRSPLGKTPEKSLG